MGFEELYNLMRKKLDKVSKIGKNEIWLQKYVKN